MKKYIILGLFVVFGFLGHGISAEAACAFHDGAKDSGEKACATNANNGNIYMYICSSKDNKWHATGNPLKHCPHGVPSFSIVHQPVPIGEPTMSPVPSSAISGVSATNPVQYIFKTYPFSNGPTDQPALPANDPLTIGHQDPSDTSDVPTDINSDGTVAALFKNISSTASISWEPTSIFDNIGFWNQPMLDTFKAFTKNNGGTTAKWYPTSVFTIANPVSKIPLIDTTINWNEVPGVVSYHFILKSSYNPLGLDTNMQTGGIDIPSLVARTYTTSLRGGVTYYWKATPLDASGNEILGPEIISNGDLQATGVGDPGSYNVSGSSNVTPAYLANPFWIHNSTVADQAYPSSVSIYTQACGIYAGHTYFTDKYGLRCDGGPHPLTFIEWKDIPDATQYEIQYAFAPIPAGTPFVDGATFGNHTTHVISNITDINSQRIGFQYDFGGMPPQGNPALVGTDSVQPNGDPSGVYWRIRALDNNTVLREDIAPSGSVVPDLPKYPYQSGFPVWSDTPTATSYVVSVAEKAADLDQLPKLTTPASLNTTVSKTGATDSSSGTFLLRKIVPNVAYDVNSAGKIVVEKMTKALKEVRISFVAINYAMGMYDWLNALDQANSQTEIQPYTNYQATDEAILNDFDNNPPSAYSDYTDAENQIYPLVSSETGLQVIAHTSINALLPNQLQFTTTSPIIIKNLSTGNAWLKILQSADKKTSTLTFDVKPNVTTPGVYQFEITKKGNDGYDLNGDQVTSYSLTYPTIGPVQVIPSLVGKDITEFSKLLPGTQYFYQVTPLKDPNPEAPNTGSTAFQWFPTSPVNSFTTPTGVSATMNIPADGDTTVSPYDIQGVTPKMYVPINSSLNSGGKSMINSTLNTLLNTPGLVSKDINWTSVVGATSYNVNIYDSKGGLYKSYTNLSGLKLTENLPVGVYTYELQAQNSTMKGAWSTRYNLSVVATINNPKVIAADKLVSAKRLKEIQDLMAPRMAVAKAYKTYLDNKFSSLNTAGLANIKAINSLKTVVSSLQTSIKTYNNARRIDIQVPATR